VTLGGVHTGDPRPIILRAEPPATAARLRRLPRTLLSMTAVAVLTTVGAAAGSWSVWSVVGSTAPSGNPTQPLWYTPPELDPASSSTEDILRTPPDNRPQGTSRTSTSTPPPSEDWGDSGDGDGGHRGPGGHSGRR